MFPKNGRQKTCCTPRLYTFRSRPFDKMESLGFTLLTKFVEERSYGRSSHNVGTGMRLQWLSYFVFNKFMRCSNNPILWLPRDLRKILTQSKVAQTDYLTLIKHQSRSWKYHPQTHKPIVSQDPLWCGVNNACRFLGGTKRTARRNH